MAFYHLLKVCYCFFIAFDQNYYFLLFPAHHIAGMETSKTKVYGTAHKKVPIAYVMHVVTRNLDF